MMAGCRAAVGRPVDAVEVGELDACLPDPQLQALGVALELLEHRRNVVRRRRPRAAVARRALAWTRGARQSPCPGHRAARCRGATSSRRRTNTGARSAPAGVHSLKLTSATSSGFSQVVGRCSGGFSANGEVARLSLRAALEQRADDGVVESGAHVTGVVQRLAVAVAEQQRAERLARALAAGVAADHELLAVLRLEFEPGTRALPGLVGAVDALGDDALEARARGPRCTAARHRRRRAPAAGARPAAGTASGSGGGRRRARRAGSDRRSAAGRSTPAPPACCAARWRSRRRVLSCARFCSALKEGRPRAIERDDLAVEDQLAGRLRGELGGDLGKGGVRSRPRRDCRRTAPGARRQ